MTSDSIDLINLALERGSSLEAGTDTAINHFTKFLAYQNKKNPTRNPYTKYSQLSPTNFEYVTSEVVSFFGDYLKRVAGIKSCSTCLAYVSRIKNQLIRDFPTIERIFEGKWYTDLRRKITQIYIKLGAIYQEPRVKRSRGVRLMLFAYRKPIYKDTRMLLQVN